MYQMEEKLRVHENIFKVLLPEKMDGVMKKTRCAMKKYKEKLIKQKKQSQLTREKSKTLLSKTLAVSQPLIIKQKNYQRKKCGKIFNKRNERRRNMENRGKQNK